MTTDRGALAALLATMTVLSAAGPATAQTPQAAPVRGLEGLQASGTQPQPDATPVPIPAAPTIVLPTATPAPRRTPRPRAVETPAAERPTTRTAPGASAPIRAPEPEARRTPTPAAPTPVATPTPAPILTPEPAPEPAPVSAPVADATPEPTAPTTTPQPTLTAPETGRAMPLWLSLVVIVVVLGALWALRRKPRSRGRSQDHIAPDAHVEPTPPPAVPETPASPAVVTPVVPAAPALAATAAPKFLEPRAKTPPPPPAAPRARVSCELRPLRAGLNMLSATVECELVVTNTGNAPAEAIRTGVALMTAHAGQDTDLAQFNAAPIGRPAAPPFALAPGETRTIRTVVAVAREAIQTMTAANRPMFVPVVATNIVYMTTGDEAQTARAWSIGIERVDSAKLAPFWLDAPARMYTTVAARPHAATFDR